MGIFINLKISKAVSKEEWDKVYKETLVLVKNFPLAESLRMKIHGVDTRCLVPTEEREEHYGWHHEKTKTGWFANGDYNSMRTAEEYFLPKNLVVDGQVDQDAGDAMNGCLLECLGIGTEKEGDSHSYELWGAKTQGEPYHMYLLAIGCLIEARLGYKAYIHGDITRGQCKKAVEIANKYLQDPIEMPDQCYADRLLNRIWNMPLSEREKLAVFEDFYLGTKDAEFGDCMRKAFSDETIESYWRERFGRYHVGQIGFDSLFNKYMILGFDLEKLCGYVKLQDKEGEDLCEAFVTRVMDAKLHLKEKNCTEPLEIDPETESPYSIWTLFAQFGFAAARNKKVNRYIPLEEIRRALNAGMRGRCEVDAIIDEYLKKEAKQTEINLTEASSSEEKFEEAVKQDASEVFRQFMDQKAETIRKEREDYDISDQEQLIFYENGDTMPPALQKVLGKLRKFLDSILEEEKFAELLSEDAKTRCQWISEHSEYFLLRDRDWEKIYSDIEENEKSFGRYYSLCRVKMETHYQIEMGVALMMNDDLYAYSKILADQEEKD